MKLEKNNIKEIIAQLTLEQKATFCVGLKDSKDMGLCARNQEIEELGIPSVIFADGPQGLRFNTPTICFPCATLLAQTWDDELIEECTEEMGKINEAFGVDLFLAPGMNIQRNILNGRNFEYFSEDPLVAGHMATAYVKGVQKSGTGSCIKHYCANSQEKYRDLASSEVSERALREIYLRAFGYTIKNADPYAVMTSYNPINGTYAAANKPLVKDVLRGEFAFNGLVTSDWSAHGGFPNMIKVENDMYSGAADQDAEIKTLVDAVNNGEVSMEQLDKCVEHVLGMCLRTNAYTKKNANKVDKVVDPAGKVAMVRKTGAQGIVLLKNDGALPKANGTFACFGNGHFSTQICGAGSGGCGTINEPMFFHAAFIRYEGIKENEEIFKLYEKHLTPDFEPASTYKEGVDNPVDDQSEVIIDYATAKKAAQTSDIAVFTIFRRTAEGTDNLPIRGDYLLNDVERDNIEIISKAFHEEGKKLVCVINSGNPMEVASWEKFADAILYTAYPGEQVGFAILDVITGNVAPAAKLACTWPVKYADAPQADCWPGSEQKTCYCEDIYVGYRYYETFGVPVSYPFGYGLTYTTFDYTDFTASVKQDGNISLSLTIKNTGDSASAEVAEFYVEIPDGKNEHPKRVLCGYKKTKVLQPGEAQTVCIDVTDDELETYVTKDATWIREGGNYRFFAGKNAHDMIAEADIELSEKEIKKVTNIFDDTRLRFRRLSKNQ